MALIEYATDEITNQLLRLCDCPGLGHRKRYTEYHESECLTLWVMVRLLDLALAEQRERIAKAVAAESDPDGFDTVVNRNSFAARLARVARETA